MYVMARIHLALCCFAFAAAAALSADPGHGFIDALDDASTDCATALDDGKVEEVIAD